MPFRRLTRMVRRSIGEPLLAAGEITMRRMIRAVALVAVVVLSAEALARGEACLPDVGNPPRPVTKADLSSMHASVSSQCQANGGEVLRLNDPGGAPRIGCLHIPANTSAISKRPLLVFLGGAIYPGYPEALKSNIVGMSHNADLSGDATRPGFILLTIEGRDTEHYYPTNSTNKGLGWDNWYRNLNRNDPAINVDVASIDSFMADVEARGIVDLRRKYITGWSNGAAMALLYGMNTPGIAATAVYTSPEPFSDVQDPCAQTPFASNPRPLMTIHNSCDLYGFCQTGSVGFRDKVRAALPSVELSSIIINAQQRQVASCEARCAGSTNRRGTLPHARWPLQWNDALLAFLRARPLP